MEEVLFITRKSPNPGFNRNLKDAFESALAEAPRESRLKHDPVQFPRKYYLTGRSREEIEVIAVFSAMLAYGKVELFLGVIQKVLTLCEERFLDLCLGRIELPEWPKYRLSTGKDLHAFVLSLGNVVARKGSLKNSFLEGWKPNQSIRDGLTALQKDILQATPKVFLPHPHGLRHLLPDPAAGGCVKRWQMFLRWMVRPDDGIDLGIWPEIPPAKLLVPLDRHISRFARNLGFTKRGSDDWKTAEEVTGALAKFCPEDPVKYDFALCHLGISGTCTHGKDPENCTSCGLSGFCLKLPRKKE